MAIENYARKLRIWIYYSKYKSYFYKVLKIWITIWMTKGETEKSFHFVGFTPNYFRVRFRDCVIFDSRWNITICSFCFLHVEKANVSSRVQRSCATNVWQVWGRTNERTLFETKNSMPWAIPYEYGTHYNTTHTHLATSRATQQNGNKKKSLAFSSLNCILERIHKTCRCSCKTI